MHFHLARMEQCIVEDEAKRDRRSNNQLLILKIISHATGAELPYNESEAEDLNPLRRLHHYEFTLKRYDTLLGVTGNGTQGKQEISVQALGNFPRNNLVSGFHPENRD